MKTIICIVLVLFVASTSSASISVGRYQDPKNEGKCTMSEDHVLEPGRHKDKRVPCGVIYCYNDGAAETYTFKELFKSGYKYGDYVDANRDYPECCERQIVRIG